MITDYHARYFAHRLDLLGGKGVNRLGRALFDACVELYGLSRLIDEDLYGEPASFRTQYISCGGDVSGLRDRLRSFSWRTLRSQVTELVCVLRKKSL